MIFDLQKEAVDSTSAETAFAELEASLKDQRAKVKADVTRRIKQAAEHGSAIVHNSVDADEGYRRAYYLCKLALNRCIGTFAYHGVEELSTSEAYDEGLDYVVNRLEEALRVRKAGN